MRRSDREITDRKELLAVIRRCDVCRLAFQDEEGYPYILPLNFGMEADDTSIVLYFHGATEGKKYALIEKYGRASFEMDCGHRLHMEEPKGYCTMEYESVIGRGRVEIVPEEEKYKALCVLMKQYHPENFQFSTAAMARTTCFKLTVESLTGKRRKKS